MFDGNNVNNAEYVVFSPEQIKSATGNNGDFGIGNPNINENYDSPDAAKLNLSDDEIRNMTHIEPYKNQFDSNFFDGQNARELHDLIHKVKYNEDSVNAAVEYIYRYLIQEIPFFEEFEKNVGFDSELFKLNLSYEDEIKKDLDDQYSVRIEFHIKYHKTNDDIMDYEKDRVNIWMFPNIKTSRKSLDLANDKDINLDPNNLDGAIDIIQKKLYGTPDKQDELLNKQFKYMKDNIHINDFDKCIPEIKKKIKDFANYVYAKYDVKINN